MAEKEINLEKDEINSKIKSGNAGKSKSKAPNGPTLMERLKSIKLKRKHLLIVIPIIFLVVVAVILVAQNLKPNEEATGAGNPSNGDTEERLYENPVNGTLITKEEYDALMEKNVFAVTINNHPKARPQNGLSEADEVMEVLTEGGITRYVGIFYQNEPEKIGPMRSLRRYMADFIAEFENAVIVHEGWASFHGHEDVYVRETDARRDVVEYGMISLQTPESRYRDEEKGAKSGYVHSLYTGYQLMSESFEKNAASLGWETSSTVEPLKFKDDAALEDRGEVTDIAIDFISLGSTFSPSSFKYNKDTNTYLRSIVGEADIDLGTGEQIAPKNVIIEWHDYRPAQDGYSRIIIDMIGKDDVLVFRDGEVVEGTWKKVDRTDRTKYYDAEGEEIELNRGQIWKVIVIKSGNTKYSTVTYTEPKTEVEPTNANE